MSTPSTEDKHPLNQQAKHPLEMLSGNDNIPPPPQKRPATPPEDRPYITYTLMAINILIFLVMFLQPKIEEQLLLAGWLYPPLIVEGNEIYRLFTAMFLHGDPGHIFFNMYALYIVGSMIEPIFGRLRFSLIYFLGGLAGSVLSLLLGTYDVPSLGASGAIFAIFAAEGVHLYQHQAFYRNVSNQLRQIVVLIVLQVGLGFLPGSRIDNWGHIGGLIGGALLAWRIAPRLQRPDFIPKSRHDLAQLDANPLQNHLPELVIYCFGLIGLLVIALNTLGA